MDENAQEIVSLPSGQRSVSVRVPLTDTISCISVSLSRVVLTVFSIALVVTDIPRTGLTPSPSDYYERVGPGIVTSWGPYEYQVAHLHKVNSTSIHASCDGESLGSLEVWSYKFDTLSIAPRAIAEHLHVAEYPACVLYRGQCENPNLEPVTVFQMFDGLVTALQRERFADPKLESRPFVFYTKSNWVDRLHQYVFRFLTKGPEIRFHSVYHRSSREGRITAHGLCDTHAVSGHSFRTESIPIFCNHQVQWKCDHPIEPTGNRQIPIRDHITIRVEDLQQRYPELELDLTVIVSTVIEQSHSDRHVVRTVALTTDALEITTLIRGQQCTTPRDCTTVFLDDYRYERVLLESDEDLWKSYLRILRGLSQSYVWLRVFLLVCGCYFARTAERNHRCHPFSRNVVDTCLTLLRIPGHTIVYGSWLPIIGYALAHHFDSCLIQMIGEYAWSSINGFYDFRLVDYVLSASIAMRNIWMNMIAWKIALRAWSVLSVRCQRSSHPECRSVLSVRPGWVGLISWLTTFSLARSLKFRDTQVVGMVELPRHTAVSFLERMDTFRNYSDYGVRFDLKTSFAVTMLVVLIVQSFSAITKLRTSRPTSMFVCRSFYVPLSAGRLWFRSAMDTYWGISLTRKHAEARSRIAPHASFLRSQLEASIPLAHEKPDTPRCSVCSWQFSPIHWKSVLGCIVHEPIFDVHTRTTPIWSMVRLTNIANMTDPIVLFRLYVIGRPLYVYRVHTGTDEPSYQVLLPIAPVESNSSAVSMPFESDGNAWWSWTRGGSSRCLEFVCVVDSRNVPWHVILNCG